MEAIDTIPIEQEKEPGSFRLIITLGIAGFISGIVLVGVYLFTKPIIEQNKAEALKTAILKVIPGAVSYQTLILKNGDLELLTVPASKDDELIYLGLNENNDPLAFAIPGAEAGFQDIIAVIYGYSPNEEAIIGFEVLESKETPGLGDKIYKDFDFLQNFEKLKVEPEIIPVKKGEKLSENEVACITGATISSKAVVKILNNSLDKWKQPILNYQNQKEI